MFIHNLGALKMEKRVFFFCFLLFVVFLLGDGQCRWLLYL